MQRKILKGNLPLAIVEAKSDSYSLGTGIQQGIEYAKILDVPFVSDLASVNESVLPFSKVIVLVLFKEKS